MADTHQKRRHPRAEATLGLLVAWQTGARRSVSRLEALGLGGLFIRTPEAPPVGSVLNMLLDLPIGEVRAHAIVRRVTANGVGIEFVQMLPHDRARLNQLLRQLLSKQNV